MDHTNQHSSRLMRFFSFDTMTSVLATLIGGVAFANMVLGFGGLASLILGVLIATAIGLSLVLRTDESSKDDSDDATKRMD
jgi:hypothetical protein